MAAESRQNSTLLCYNYLIKTLNLIFMAKGNNAQKKNVKKPKKNGKK